MKHSTNHFKFKKVLTSCLAALMLVGSGAVMAGHVTVPIAYGDISLLPFTVQGKLHLSFENSSLTTAGQVLTGAHYKSDSMTKGDFVFVTIVPTAVGPTAYTGGDASLFLYETTANLAAATILGWRPGPVKCNIAFSKTLGNVPILVGGTLIDGLPLIERVNLLATGFLLEFPQVNGKCPKEAMISFDD